MKRFSVKNIFIGCVLAGGVGLSAFYFTMHSMQQRNDLADARKEAPGKFIQLPGGLTHYTLQGADNNKVIVLVTGGGITGMEVWKNTIPFLVDKGYRVLAYDMFGRGYSDRPEEANTPELLELQLKSLVDKLGIKKPFDMAAMSFGAIIALDFNKQFPGMVDKLVLLDPTATGEYKISKLLRVPVVTPLVMTIYWYPKAIENQRKEFVNQPMFEDYTNRLHYFMEFKGYKEMTHDTWMYILNQDRLSLLSDFPPNKVLVIYGDKDPYFPAGNIPVFEKVYPSLKSNVIEGAGHMPQYEKPEEVNEVMLDFLQTEKKQ